MRYLNCPHLSGLLGVNATDCCCDRNHIDISPDSQFVVTVSYRQPITFFKVWDLTTGELQTQGRLSSSLEKHTLNNIVVSHDNAGDGVRIIGSTPNGLKFWTLQDKIKEADPCKALPLS